jgi:hypothetical protein
MYSIFTVSNYIENKQIKVLGYINYERASQYKSLVENVAINEKYITDSGDTVEYLKSLVYYDCAVVENRNGDWVITNDHVILWDDIIDFEKTEILNTNHVYKMEFKFKNLSNYDNFTKDDVIKTLTNAIASTYNIEKDKVEINFTEIYDNSLDSIESQYEKSKAIINEANNTLLSLVSMETSAKQINSQFTDNNILGKINDLGTKMNDIDKSLTTIISRLK